MKTVYERLEHELNKSFTISQGLGNKVNKLIMLQLETEDDIVIDGINDIIDHLKEAKKLYNIKNVHEVQQGVCRDQGVNAVIICLM